MSASDFQSFTHVARWYNALMSGVPYEQWVRYIGDLLADLGAEPESVLDLACGTGRVSRLLARKGYRVVGVDGSPAMIEEARRCTPGGEVEYFCQRAEDLSLGRRFDLVVSLFDSLNYITDPHDLARSFRQVAGHLRPAGLLIFDLNGIYAFEADLFTQESYGRGRPVEYSWKSRYDPGTRICTVDMVFHVKQEGRREEFREVHVQRAYEIEEVNAMLEAAGLEILSVYDAYTKRPAHAKSDRIYWIARLPL